MGRARCSDFPLSYPGSTHLGRRFTICNAGSRCDPLVIVSTPSYSRFETVSDIRAQYSLQKRSQSVEWERTRALASRYFDDALRACRAGRSIPEELASDTFLTAGIALLTVCVGSRLGLI
jgi:hypothetical protein